MGTMSVLALVLGSLLAGGGAIAIVVVWRRLRDQGQQIARLDARVDATEKALAKSETTAAMYREYAERLAQENRSERIPRQHRRSSIVDLDAFRRNHAVAVLAGAAAAASSTVRDHPMPVLAALAGAIAAIAVGILGVAPSGTTAPPVAAGPHTHVTSTRKIPGIGSADDDTTTNTHANARTTEHTTSSRTTAPRAPETSTARVEALAHREASAPPTAAQPTTKSARHAQIQRQAVRAHAPASSGTGSTATGSTGSGSTSGGSTGGSSTGTGSSPNRPAEPEQPSGPARPAQPITLLKKCTVGVNLKPIVKLCVLPQG